MWREGKKRKELVSGVEPCNYKGSYRSLGGAPLPASICFTPTMHKAAVMLAHE